MVDQVGGAIKADHAADSNWAVLASQNIVASQEPASAVAKKNYIVGVDVIRAGEFGDGVDSAGNVVILCRIMVFGR